MLRLLYFIRYPPHKRRGFKGWLHLIKVQNTVAFCTGEHGTWFKNIMGAVVTQSLWGGGGSIYWTVNCWKSNCCLLSYSQGHFPRCAHTCKVSHWHDFYSSPLPLCDQHWDGLVCRVEKLLDVTLNVDGRESPAVAFEWLSVWPDEKLLKVPGDVIPANGTPDDTFRVVH